ncbi:MAG: pantoate--beta-alanine ligase [Pseudomonadales bacterium]
MQIITTIQALRDALDWRRQNKALGLVITKGHLHGGSEALIDASVAANDLTVVASYAGAHLFFDQDAYQAHSQIPHLETARLEERGVDLLFAPGEAELYPTGHDGLTRIALPKIGCNALMGAEKVHCQELVTLVTKFCNITQPNMLILGEKHYQLLHLAERTLADLNLATQVRRVPVVREADGLVIATRNSALSELERARAPLLYQTLKDIAHAIGDGARHFDKLEQTARIALRGGHFKTEYVTICDAQTLLPPDQATQDYRILGAAHMGNVRLIDNVYVST